MAPLMQYRLLLWVALLLVSWNVLFLPQRLEEAWPDLVCYTRDIKHMALVRLREQIFG
jgi:hypothetical protein